MLILLVRLGKVAVEIALQGQGQEGLELLETVRIKV